MQDRIQGNLNSFLQLTLKGSWLRFACLKGSFEILSIMILLFGYFCSFVANEIISLQHRYAFVVYSKDKDGEAAKNDLNNKDFGGNHH